MKSLKDIIIEKLIINKNIKIIYTDVINKIFYAFGFKDDEEESEDDDFTKAIKNWVKDNNVKEVEFYTKSIKELKDIGTSQDILDMYSEKTKALDKYTKKMKTLASNAVDFDLEGNKDILLFLSRYGDELYALKTNK
jgi:hypothetical protein